MILNIEQLTYVTPRRETLLRGLNARLGEGHALVVTGANGTGKSTLLKLISGLLPPTRGRISLGCRFDELQYLSQIHQPECHLPLTIQDVLEFNGPDAVETALGIGLVREEHLPLSWNRASGGERQRTLLTRLLTRKPKLLLLDEPTNHLDVGSVQAVRRVLVDYVRGGGSLVVASHHDLFNAEADIRVNSLHFEATGVLA